MLRQDLRVQAARRHDRVRLARRAGGRAALRRARAARTGEVEFDGPTQDAIARYQRLLAASAIPAELEAGLREWGSGEARDRSGALLGEDGEERKQFLAGEPMSLELRIRPTRARPRRALRSSSRRGRASSPPSDASRTAELGWDAAPASETLRFDVDRCRSPTAASSSASD